MQNTTVTSSQIENTPNAAKLINSLRHLDYTNLSAVCDIIDNSVDAEASQIWINILSSENGGVEKIEIIDDGKGMDRDTLDEALKLGSETGKNAVYDLGLYGMGLVTASISMGRRLEVITKAKGLGIYRAVQDLDTIQEVNRFIKLMEEVEGKEALAFEKFIMELEKKHINQTDKNIQTSQVNSATKVTISKIDRFEMARASAFANKLSERIGQVFRKFIQAGKCSFYVNGNQIDAIDPIMDYEPSLLMEDIIKLEGGDIRISIYELKDYGTEINHDKNLNIANQGFYVLRNNREIATGESFGIFHKHNDFNLLRVEFNYPATLDSLLNTGFSKQRIRFDQSIGDKVSKICNPFIRQVRARAKQKQKDNREKKEDFSNIEKYISQKAHLLKTPPSEIEQRAIKTGSDKEKTRKESSHAPRLDITKRKRIDVESLKVSFRMKALGERGPLYEPDQERDTVIVYWNTDHPFYLEVVAPNADHPDIFNPLAYLVYCQAGAELMSKDNSDTQEIIQNIRWDVGRNLAVLLK
jgi:hypothetical protein